MIYFQYRLQIEIEITFSSVQNLNPFILYIWSQKKHHLLILSQFYEITRDNIRQNDIILHFIDIYLFFFYWACYHSYISVSLFISIKERFGCFKLKCWQMYDFTRGALKVSLPSQKIPLKIKNENKMEIHILFNVFM